MNLGNKVDPTEPSPRLGLVKAHVYSDCALYTAYGIDRDLTRDMDEIARPNKGHIVGYWSDGLWECDPGGGKAILGVGHAPGLNLIALREKAWAVAGPGLL